MAEPKARAADWTDESRKRGTSFRARKEARRVQRAGGEQKQSPEASRKNSPGPARREPGRPWPAWNDPNYHRAAVLSSPLSQPGLAPAPARAVAGMNVYSLADGTETCCQPFRNPRTSVSL
jgi:hypothetical protein